MRRFGIAAGIAASFLVSLSASAHVVVKPGETGIGAYETFTVGVPSEKESNTVGLRLELPPGLTSVMPYVKPGWSAEVKRGANGEATEILWSGGVIPPNMRDDFMFSARTPAEPATLTWKAYQIYSDAVVSWNLLKNETQPLGADGTADFSSFGPASYTNVINDLKAPAEGKPKESKEAMTALYVSIAALLFSLVSPLLVKKGRR